MMNLHLAEISTQVAADAIAVLTCDGAGCTSLVARWWCRTTSFCCTCRLTVPS